MRYNSAVLGAVPFEEEDHVNAGGGDGNNNSSIGTELWKRDLGIGNKRYHDEIKINHVY